MVVEQTEFLSVMSFYLREKAIMEMVSSILPQIIQT